MKRYSTTKSKLTVKEKDQDTTESQKAICPLKFVQILDSNMDQDRYNTAP